MHLALLIEDFDPARGGAESYAASFAERLAAAGHRVSVVCDRGIERPGLEVFRLGLWRRPKWRWIGRFSDLSVKRARSLGADVVWSLAKTLGADVLQPHGGVHAATLEASLASSRGAFERGLRRASRWVSPKQWAFFALETAMYDRFATQGGPILIALSRRTAGHMTQHYGVPAEAVRVVPNGVDCARFRPGGDDGGLRARLATGRREPIVAFVAHQYRLKGFECLLRAAARSKTPWLIAAAGRARPSDWRPLAESLGVGGRIRWLGALAEPEKLYAAADALVHPSFYDPCSLVAIEALACGLPVVTTAANGASELMLNGQEGCILPDPWDSDALARAIDAVLRPEVREVQSRHARALAEEHTWERHFAILLGILNEARVRKP